MARELAICRTINDLRSCVKTYRKETGGRVGLVPTMGFFHEGHLSLMRAARQSSGLVVVSIFVNPAQFGQSEDLDDYPRDAERDHEQAGAAGVDVIFSPPVDEMYPQGFETTVNPGSVAEGLCGLSRPGHFLGVATVVAKLFNIVGPDAAWFGQKDAQQVAVIKRIAADLNFDLSIHVCPTVREEDGLAMSSRNVYLSKEERQHAPVLYRSLNKALGMARRGETDTGKIKRAMRRYIASNYLVELEYVKIVDPDSMESLKQIGGPALAAVAAKVGSARLIDNILLPVPAMHESTAC